MFRFLFFLLFKARFLLRLKKSLKNSGGNDAKRNEHFTGAKNQY
jgi:hypothetical protein